MVDQGKSFGGRERALGTATVIELSGELDILATAALGGLVDEVTGQDHPDVVLDLSSVTFIDCGGLSLLCRARRRTEERGGRLRLAGLRHSPRVLLLLRLTGMTRSFECWEGPLPGAEREAEADCTRGSAIA